MLGRRKKEEFEKKEISKEDADILEAEIEEDKKEKEVPIEDSGELKQEESKQLQLNPQEIFGLGLWHLSRAFTIFQSLQ